MSRPANREHIAMKRLHVAAFVLPLCMTVAGCATAATNQTAANAGAAAADNSAEAEHAMHHRKHPHIVTTKSNNDFEATLSKLQAAIDARNFKTFAVVDHAKGAASIDQELRPTTLVIFGNPMGGTPLMQAAQTMGVDLPLKALVYQDADGAVMIATTDIAATLHEHGVEGLETLQGRIAGALQAISDEAAN